MIDSIILIRNLFRGLIKRGINRVVIDLSEVDYIDSMGLAAIAGFSKSISSLEGDLRISDVPPKIESLFRITKLDRILSICPTQEEALAQMTGGHYEQR